ncbi:protein DEHYDRATION-INDUCED 19 homolog 3-like isoform X2 [Hordeum vulgare subsp. vulgare]|uniref:Protein dehydration-induced 19 C-terminal domain-containing protein n=1 Tax=Hordeum vulgare subsp. vulgare TaxID=112509 RepID=M0Y3N3_HORVV|nr:protein DEHYDRATION-INDUCED 19 homolog 3-like isoform X2 [Hordeum vulgare subsp. vulgare]
MDSEHWISRLAAAKRFYAAQLGHIDDMAGMGMGMGMEEVDMDMEDDGEMDMEMEMQLEEARWPEVACPYCYEDYDLGSLCVHLEEDHPYEPHPAPCPICSEKITRDMLNHITMHHGYLFKALLGGGHSHRSRNTTTTTTNIYADPLLSSFGLGFATSDAEEPSKSSVPVLDDTSLLKEAPPQPWESSIDSSLTSEEREQKRKQATSRATFVQDLVLSTLFGDD